MRLKPSLITAAHGLITVLTAIFSLYLVLIIYVNAEERAHVAQVIETMQQSAAHSDSLEKPAPDLENSHSIELAALGFRLQVINESTWSAIFKLCFLWLFFLATTLGYRVVLARLKTGRRWD